MARIAFTTFGILRAPLGEPQVQGFLNISDAVFESAIHTRGFLGAPHMEMDPGDRPKPRFFVKGKHPFAPTTLSLWADLESVCAFAYNGLHSEALRNREEWFLKPEWPTYVAWWPSDDDYRRCTSTIHCPNGRSDLCPGKRPSCRKWRIRSLGRSKWPILIS